MKKTLIILLIIGLVVFTAIIGIVGYLLITKKSEPAISTQREANNNTTSDNIANNTEPTDNQTTQTFLTYTIPKYSSYPEVGLTYPESWIMEKTVTAGQPEYSFTKNGYELMIRRVEGGGVECHFDSNFPAEMADFNLDISQYDYKKISSNLGDFYYFDTGSKYEFCGPSSQVTGKLVEMNMLGLITFETPANPSSEIMDEMVAIIESAQ
ncbi:hypothetical protein JW978_04165 [Candidatus Dojkabacteria bacterium]|nr:hypothetical protein [Candidatus Dojkabacteria bacterium]